MARTWSRSGKRFRTAAAGILFIFAGATVQAWQVELVSRVHDRLSETGAGAVHAGEELSGNGLLHPPSVSADGRYVAFVSPATNLVPGQKDSSPLQNGDVFLRDLSTGATTLVSHVQGSPERSFGGDSTEAVLSADGRWVAYTGVMTLRLTFPLGTSEKPAPYLFLYDRVSGTNTLVAEDRSSPSSRFSEPALSADGRYLAFVSNAPSLVPGQAASSGARDVFLHDRVEGTMRLVSHASSSLGTPVGGESPAISADGRYVAFLSGSADLVPGQEPGESAFLYDRISQTVRRIGPAEAPAALSADGRYAAVAAEATTYLWDRETGTQTVLSQEAGTANAAPEGNPVAISADGRYVAFSAWDDHRVPGQEGDVRQGLFLYDRISGSFTLAGRRGDSPTVPAEGVTAPAFSADGRYLVYMSRDEIVVPGQDDANLSWDVFLFDRVSATTRLLSGAQGSPSDTGDLLSFLPAVSADGSAVVFWSHASDLVAGLEDTNQGQDLFLSETASGELSAISLRAPDLPSLSPGSRSAAGSISADGRWIAFESDSPFLIAGQVDTNGERDVFLYDRTTKTTILVSRRAGSETATGDGRSAHPLVSADGRYVAFESEATDLEITAPQANNSLDLFLFDRLTGTTRLVGQTGLASSDAERNLEKQISPDGRWVVFISDSNALVPGQRDQGGTFDVFLWDRDTGSTILVSRSSAGPAVTGDGSSFFPAMSADGRFVAFASVAGDLVPGQIDENPGLDLFLFDRRTGRTSLVSHAPGSAVTATGEVEAPSISADGRWVLFHSFSGDVVSDGQGDGLFLYDRTLRTNARIGDGIDGRISADGKAIAFLDPFGRIHHLNRSSGTLTLVTQGVRSGPGDVRSFSISANGRFVAYSSDATDVVPGLTPTPERKGSDIYLFDRAAGTSVLASPDPASPRTAPGFSEAPILSADGRHVAFSSFSPLVAGDLNLRLDAYVFTSPAPVSVPVCTLFDSRRRQDRPILRTGLRRDVRAHGRCSVPATAKSVVVKITAVNPSGRGNLRFYPADSTPRFAGLLRFERGKTRSGVFTIPLAANGTGTFAVLPQVAGNGTVHGVVEVSGYIE